jgi:hypothetical protein
MKVMNDAPEELKMNNERVKPVESNKERLNEI